jgi:hypothetical protein
MSHKKDAELHDQEITIPASFLMFPGSDLEL